MIEGALFRAVDARLRDSDGRRHRLRDCELLATRVGLMGRWGPLFRLLGGECTLVSGTLSIGGVQIPRELAGGRVGVALRPLVWPDRWTVHDYLTTSAELASVSARGARAACERALLALGLAHLGTRRLSLLSEPEGRGIKLAEALITDPMVLVVEAPTDDLDALGASWVLEVLRRASAGRQLVVSFGNWPTTAAGHSLLHAMETIARLDSETMDSRTPAEMAAANRRRCRLVLAEPASALIEALEQSGWTLTQQPVPGDTPPAAPSTATEWIGELPPTEPVRRHIERLQELVLTVGTPVLEFVPDLGLADELFTSS